MVLIESIATYLALDAGVALIATTDLDKMTNNVDTERNEGEMPNEYAARCRVNFPRIFPITNLVLKRRYRRLERAMEKRTDLEELAFLERREKALRELSTDAAGLYANVLLNSTSGYKA